MPPNEKFADCCAHLKKAWQAERRWRRSEKRLLRLLCSLSIWLLGLLHGIDQAHKLLGSMKYGNIVMFPLGTFLGKVGSKYRVPIADKSGCIKDGISQISGAAHLHVGMTAGKLS